jgi:hypothetical protein
MNRAVWIGGLAAGAVALGAGVAYAAKSSAGSSSKPTPAPGTTQTVDLTLNLNPHVGALPGMLIINLPGGVSNVSVAVNPSTNRSPALPPAGGPVYSPSQADATSITIPLTGFDGTIVVAGTLVLPWVSVITVGVG